MPRCLHCNTKFIKTKKWQQGRFKFCIETDECYDEFAKVRNAFQKSEEERKRKKESKAVVDKMKEEVKTKSDYEKELEKVVNEYVRLRDRNEPCISCDAPPGTYKLTAGHYFPAGSNKNIRFDLDNIHSQCWYNCNSNKSGNLSEYLPRLIKKIGQQAFDELCDRKNRPSHYSIPELIEMKVKFKDMVKDLKRKIG